jgi:hypothetical protein
MKKKYTEKDLVRISVIIFVIAVYTFLFLKILVLQ